MSNKIKQEIDKIEIPKELHERSKMGVLKAKSEKQGNKKSYNLKVISAAASLLLLIGAYVMYSSFSQNIATPNQDRLIIGEDGGIKIPMIQLPEDTSTSADMIGLIVYNGKIYTETTTKIDAEDAKEILGEMLGTTKGNIDEWSKQDEYDKEFASTIGGIDVYSVKGYDKKFRIMIYEEREENSYAAFYESLNGITVYGGEDIFSKLRMTGNVLNAKYRTFTDWYNGIDNYHYISNMNVLNEFVEYLNKAEPFPSEINSNPIRDSRNNQQYREVIIKLNDGSKVKLTLIEGGYIYYGYMNIHFKMDDDVFLKLWTQLQ